MTLLAHDRYCDEITHQAGQLRELLTAGADLGATVPTCPEWTLEDLVRHVGRALRWTGHLVRTRASAEVPMDQVAGVAGPAGRGDAAALDEWFAEAASLVVGALRAAGPDGYAWSWMGRNDAGFWARRMCHELVVHGADGALAAGRAPCPVAAEVAADALDEWLEIVQFVQRALPDGSAKDLRAPGRSIHLHATDTDPGLNAEWLIELPEEGVSWRRGHERATVALRGPLTSVLLAFYRRLPPNAPELQVIGDPEVLRLWLDAAKFG
ncbi:maleylpyruvate isomerase family mycothiol-dependent enzyme [Streptomyces sp. JW3]|uniref:maleylpyruvate isomerase family mycothiol-dependent enzyme n=1 Tax=Streptomyces sp. JW3 TaxID=3456955 RepID=UPI003FA4093E